MPLAGLGRRRRRTGTRICRQSRDNKVYDIFGLAENLLPFFGQMWPTTTGRLTSVTVFFAKFAKRQYGRSVLEQMHRPTHGELSK